MHWDNDNFHCMLLLPDALLCQITNWKEESPITKWNATFEESDLIDHFEELCKEAGPIATCFVREHRGELSERDTNEEAEYLSPYWSKRQCYYKFCASMGVDVKSNSKGNLLMIRMKQPPPPELEEEVLDDGNSSSSSSSTRTHNNWRNWRRRLYYWSCV